MDAWKERVKQHNEDAKTNCIRTDLQISLTDKEHNNLKLLAYKAGFGNAGELLSSFVGDLTGWLHSNGSDERDLADQWYERAFGCFIVYFRYFLFNNDYGLNEMNDMIEDAEFFEEIYKDYKDEYDGQELQSKDDCLKELREIVKVGKEL